MSHCSRSVSAVHHGFGGCANEMLRVWLDDRELFQLLFRAVEDTAKADMPTVRKAFMAATMTAL